MKMIKTETELNTMSPLIWAYIGDSVFELYIRTHLVKTTKLKPHKLHIETIKYVRASAQANILMQIQGLLNEEELEIIRRTRNCENHHLPKSADLTEYRLATALEGLIGHLYLAGKEERLNDLLNKCLDAKI